MTNDKPLLIGITGIIAAVLLLAGFFAGGLGWWWLSPQVERPATRIEQLPPLEASTAAPPQPETPLAAVESPATAPVGMPAGDAAAPPPATAAAEVEPVVTPVEPALTRLEIPALNLVAPIVPAPVQGESWQVDHLGQRVGHLQKTAAPGSVGNAVLAGHVSLAGGAAGPFAGLARLSGGEVLLVYQGGQRFEYVVNHASRVDASAIEVTYPSPHAELTLITCDGWNETEGRYLARLVVKAEPAEE